MRVLTSLKGDSWDPKETSIRLDRPTKVLVSSLTLERPLTDPDDRHHPDSII